MKIRVIEHVNAEAEGDCHGFPYNTTLISAAGVLIVFWTGDKEPGSIMPALADALVRARAARDIVGAQACIGNPTGYWAHNDIA